MHTAARVRAHGLWLWQRAPWIDASFRSARHAQSYAPRLRHCVQPLAELRHLVHPSRGAAGAAAVAAVAAGAAAAAAVAAGAAALAAVAAKRMAEACFIAALWRSQPSRSGSKLGSALTALTSSFQHLRIIAKAADSCPGLHRVECAVFNPGSSSWICSLSPPRRRQKFVKHGITFHIRVLLKLCSFGFFSVVHHARKKPVPS